MKTNVINRLKNTNILTDDSGAAAVEFALALVAFFLFFGLYTQCVHLIVEHGRIAFNGFATARTFDVRGKYAALYTGEAIDSEALIEFSTNSSTVDLKKQIWIPEILRPVISVGKPYYTLTHSSPLFDEQQLRSRLKGDN